MPELRDEGPEGDAARAAQQAAAAEAQGAPDPPREPDLFCPGCGTRHDGGPYEVKGVKMGLAQHTCGGCLTRYVNIAEQEEREGVLRVGSPTERALRRWRADAEFEATHA